MLHFRECPDKGYRARTIENASADCTIAFAIDFYTGGEILTKNSTLNQNKLYIPIAYPFSTSGFLTEINSAIISMNKNKVENINIAGNGIYTMSLRNVTYTQEQLDEDVYKFLETLINHPNLENKIILIRSGGQTGFDEAGAKAGIKLGIETLIYAPKDWRFRGMDGDIANEEKFKARFND